MKRRCADVTAAYRGVARPRWFEAIETQMAETGVAIAAARAELVRLLAAMIEKLPDSGPFPQSDIA
jgi:DNA replication and repair protein RecF